MNGTFIGMGHNPEGPDLPTGLGMNLAQDPQAMEAFGCMSRAEKADLIAYVQGASTGEDAARRISQAISALHDGSWNRLV